jgi:protein-tyrosine phosphatase
MATEEKREQVSVLFVCLGNICRSPTAEGVFRKLVADAGLHERVRIDSAGTAGYHEGHPPDARAAAAAAARGFLLDGIRARRVVAEDFEAFDLILAMDEDNMVDLRRVAPENARAELALIARVHARRQRDGRAGPLLRRQERLRAGAGSCDGRLRRAPGGAAAQAALTLTGCCLLAARAVSARAWQARAVARSASCAARFPAPFRRG